jgi:diguanylate cyclase (GGDEF)-like protein
VAALRRRGRYSALITPIVLSGRIWGELYVARLADQPPYTSVEADFAAVLGAQVSAGLARAAHLAEIERLAHTDALTGLANRRAIDLRLDEAMAGHAADGTDACLAICDVNGLKRVNDTRGHAAGDRMLVRFAGLLSTAAASLPGSVAGRLGGDEFCLITSGHPVDVVLPVVRRLCERALELNGGRGAACGIASTEAAAGGADSRDRLFRLADAAQYEAKRTASAEPAIAGSEPDPGPVPGRPPHERRRVRGRVAPDTERLLAAALDAIAVAGIAEPCHPAAVIDRLAAVTDTLARAVDAAGWTILTHDPDGWRPVRSMRNRPDPGDTSLILLPGPYRVEIHGDDATLPLPPLRPTARAALAVAVVGD